MLDKQNYDANENNELKHSEIQKSKVGRYRWDCENPYETKKKSRNHWNLNLNRNEIATYAIAHNF